MRFLDSWATDLVLKDRESVLDDERHTGSEVAAWLELRNGDDSLGCVDTHLVGFSAFGHFHAGCFRRCPVGKVAERWPDYTN